MTYIRLAHGFVYLVVVMDRHSRYILSWELSITLADYFRFYNEERPHEALGYRTPHEVYFGTPAALTPAREVVA